jgi:transposase-like protein
MNEPKNRRVEMIPFFKSSSEIQKVVCRTDAIESANHTIRKAVNNRQPSPNDDVALKFIFLLDNHHGL